MWNGPAPARKYSKAIHVQWRKLWDYAGGQMAYQGIHQLDLARWLCGVDYPTTVYCTGKRFAPSAAETPDTQLAVFEFPELYMTYERTEFTPYMLRSDPEIRNGDISCRLGGRRLQIDPATEQILDDPEVSRLLRREYRQPWAVEEVVV